VSDAFVIDPQTDEIHVSFHAFDADEYSRRSLISTEDLKIICQKRPTITSFKLADLCH
jgi:hypothetical protein